METITKVFNIYSFDELTEMAKHHAHENGPDFSDLDNSEFENTLHEFERIFDCKVYRYSVDDYSFNYAFVLAGAAAECPENRPLRLARYLWNNYARYIQKGRYYSLSARQKDGRTVFPSRHSKVTMEMDNCPLTGYYCDYDILRPVLDCLRYKVFFNSFHDLVTACLDSFFKAWQAAIEYNASMECFADMAENNGLRFLENGALYTA